MLSPKFLFCDDAIIVVRFIGNNICFSCNNVHETTLKIAFLIKGENHGMMEVLHAFTCFFIFIPQIDFLLNGGFIIVIIVDYLELIIYHMKLFV